MVLTLDNGQVITVFDFKDIKDHIDKEIYDYILEQVILKNSNLTEKIHELDVELDDVYGELEAYKESEKNIISRLEDIIDEDEDNDRDNIVYEIQQLLKDI